MKRGDRVTTPRGDGTIVTVQADGCDYTPCVRRPCIEVDIDRTRGRPSRHVFGPDDNLSTISR